ncbi:uncharacterized protein LOC129746084 [Uranotaenia lowii]|uniref:uncharacterized protein LOC129746084 n=1 Tax=Uranotaenia lowii TaxID=190385 RepID=UPI00247B133B|nr:uncharacterized protein LOC129746084 [Uranotaenia lowii]
MANPSIPWPALVLVLIATLCHSIYGETYECSLEPYGHEQSTFCVFRGVQYPRNSSGSTEFKAPPGKHTRVVFEDSEMMDLPREFLEKFGQDLKVLNVGGCKLRSVVITPALEELYAIDNYIEKIIVHQAGSSSPLREIHLQSNRLRDISNVTKSCKNVRIVDLSRNQQLAADNEIDLFMFDGFEQLEYLLMADVGALYLKTEKVPKMPALTLLDFSMNNLLASDLKVDYFQNFERLSVLRLNDNGFSEIEYQDFVDVKSLKQVYLEGNLFECGYLLKMKKFLETENNITLPVARPAGNCAIGYRVEAGMCCKNEELLVAGMPTKAGGPPMSVPATVTTPRNTFAGTPSGDNLRTGKDSSRDVMHEAGSSNGIMVNNKSDSKSNGARINRWTVGLSSVMIVSLLLLNP